jgi:hypothetical protein
MNKTPLNKTPLNKTPLNKTMRVLIALALVITAVAVQGCGRKEKLTPPRGADYPRQYPRE